MQERTDISNKGGLTTRCAMIFALSLLLISCGGSSSGSSSQTQFKICGDTKSLTNVHDIATGTHIGTIYNKVLCTSNQCSDLGEDWSIDRPITASFCTSALEIYRDEETKRLVDIKDSLGLKNSKLNPGFDEQMQLINITEGF
jgi:hypothetical protein